MKKKIVVLSSTYHIYYSDLLKMRGTCADVVMLVDDNEIDLFINKKILEFNTFSKDLVALPSGQDALDFLNNAEDVRLPKVIFLDLNMPLMDGFKFLFEFSKLSRPVRDKCSVVVLTSSNNPNDREKIEANNDVIMFLSKPLDDNKLDLLRSKIDSKV